MRNRQKEQILPAKPFFARYVAIGDSSTEGLEDPDGAGGYRGWANRLAERLAVAQGGLLYANLGVRGRRTREILEQQLDPALDLEPDLVTFFAGTNDLLGRHFDLDGVMEAMDRIQAGLRHSGATVLTFTLPDLRPVMPLAKLLGERIERLNEGVRQVARRRGSLLVDFAAHAVASDARLWCEDRLHANAAGHARIAAALAHALGLDESDDSWSRPLPELPPASLLSRTRREARWLSRHLIPWCWRHLQGRSSGDGRGPKRPQLQPVEGSRPSPASASKTWDSQ